MISIIPGTNKVLVHPEVISEKDRLLIKFTYRPEVWTSSTPYIEKRDVVIPSVFNGFHYVCTSGGISNVTEPVWSLKSNDLTQDRGTNAETGVIWKGVPYGYLLQQGQTITASTWEGVNCTVATGSFTDNNSEVQVTGITAGSTYIDIINTITFSATSQVLSRRIRFKVTATK